MTNSKCATESESLLFVKLRQHRNPVNDRVSGINFNAKKFKFFLTVYQGERSASRSAGASHKLIIHVTLITMWEINLMLMCQ